ncbi:MAG: restriction endonuclease subunit S [Myxococcota bacterium]
MSEWKTVRMGDAALKIGSGATPKGGGRVYLPSGRVALIRSQNVHNNGLKANGLVYITVEHAAKLDNAAVQSGDLLLNITGFVARCCQVPDSVLPARVSQHVAIIRTNPDILNSQYLRYYLVSPDKQAELLAWASAGVTRDALTKGMLEDLEIKAPKNLSEQKAIAHVLSTLDDKVDLSRRMNQTLLAIAQAVFGSWFVHFDPVVANALRAGHPIPQALRRRARMLRHTLNHSPPPGFSRLFPNRFQDSSFGAIPIGWVACQLGECVESFNSERVRLNRRQRARRPGPFPYHGATGVLGYVDDYLFDGVYVLVGENGTVTDDDGYPVTRYVWDKFWVNQHAHVLRGKAGTCSEYLYLLLKNTPVKPYVAGVVQPGLNQKNLRSIPVVLPPPNVRAVFSEMISPLFAQYRSYTAQSETLRAIQQHLLPRLLNGKISVRPLCKQLFNEKTAAGGAGACGTDGHDSLEEERDGRQNDGIGR